MIAILTKESFYTLALDTPEFLSLIDEGKVDHLLIRAKSRMHFPKDTLESVINLLESQVSKINACFCEYGNNQYSMKLVRSIDDLRYYTGPDNNMYTCEEDYNYSVASDFDITSVVEPSTTIGDTSSVEPVGVTGEVGGNVDEEIVIIPPVQDIPTDNNDKNIEEEIVIGEISPEIIEKASFFDVVLRRLHPLKRHISEDLYGSVKRYIDRNNDNVCKLARQQFLKEANIDNLKDDTDTNGIVIKNALGESTDILDSVATFPVYSTILTKKDFSKSFNKTQLLGSSFIRVCPIGLNENSELIGYVDIVEFNSMDINTIEKDIKRKLDKKGIKYNSLTPAEKYAEWEKEAAIFNKNRRTILQSKKLDIININDTLNDLKTEKYQITSVFDNKNNPLWATNEVIALDNRLLKGNFAKTIESQLLNSKSSIRTTKKGEEVVEPVVQHVKLSDISEVAPKEGKIISEDTEELAEPIVQRVNLSGTDEDTQENIAAVIRDIMEKRRSENQPKVGEDNSSVLILSEDTESTFANEAANPPLVIHLPGPVDTTVRATDSSVIEMPEKTDSTLAEESKNLKMAEFVSKIVKAGIKAERIKVNSYDLEGKLLIKSITPQPINETISPTESRVMVNDLLFNIAGNIKMGGIDPTNPEDKKIVRK